MPAATCLPAWHPFLTLSLSLSLSLPYHTSLSLPASFLGEDTHRKSHGNKPNYYTALSRQLRSKQNCGRDAWVVLGRWWFVRYGTGLWSAFSWPGASDPCLHDMCRHTQAGRHGGQKAVSLCPPACTCLPSHTFALPPACPLFTYPSSSLPPPTAPYATPTTCLPAHHTCTCMT